MHTRSDNSPQLLDVNCTVLDALVLEYLAGAELIEVRMGVAPVCMHAGLLACRREVFCSQHSRAFMRVHDVQHVLLLTHGKHVSVFTLHYTEGGGALQDLEHFLGIVIQQCHAQFRRPEELYCFAPDCY
jgi:hypothetical protein